MFVSTVSTNNIVAANVTLLWGLHVESTHEQMRCHPETKAKVHPKKIHPTVTGIGHLICKCLCPSMCVHLATSGIFVYTGVTVDNSHQGGYPSHCDDLHRAFATCMSLAGTHRVFCSNHDLVKPLINIYIRGMNPLRR